VAVNPLLIGEFATGNSASNANLVAFYFNGIISPLKIKIGSFGLRNG
jgi:hypothetical protein